MAQPLTAVRITVHSGSVKKADLLGKSDPYVVLKLDGSTQTTSVVRNSLAPEWNETFQLPVTSPTPVLTLEAFDKDIDKDDPLGSATVDLRPLATSPDGMMRRMRVPLLIGTKEEGWLDISAVASWKVALETAASAEAARQYSRLSLTIQGGRGFTKGDLLSKPDPYVVVQTCPDGHGDVFQTSVKNNTSEPLWGETHEFDMRGETDIRMEVFDKDVIGKNLLGEIQVPFKELGLQHGKGQRWIPVFKKNKQSGEVLIIYTPLSDGTRRSGG